jgi:hypothetical protein
MMMINFRSVLALSTMSLSLSGCATFIVTPIPSKVNGTTVNIVGNGYTKYTITPSVLGNCNTVERDLITENNILGGVFLKVTGDVNYVFPIIDDLSSICNINSLSQKTFYVPAASNNVTEQVAFAVKNDRRFSDVAKAAVNVSTAVATGGALNTITTIGSYAQLPTVVDLAQKINNQAANIAYALIRNSAGNNEWGQASVSGYIVRVDSGQNVNDAVRNFNVGSNNPMLSISLEKRGINSLLSNSAAGIAAPTANQVLMTSIMDFSSGQRSTKQLSSFITEELHLAEVRQVSSLNSLLPVVHKLGFQNSTDDFVILYRSVYAKSQSENKPAMLDAADLTPPQRARWIELYPTDWILDAEYPEGVLISETWKYKFNPLLKSLRDVFSNTSSIKQNWAKYLTDQTNGTVNVTYKFLNQDESLVQSGKNNISTKVDELAALVPVQNQYGCFGYIGQNAGYIVVNARFSPRSNTEVATGSTQVSAVQDSINTYVFKIESTNGVNTVSVDYASGSILNDISNNFYSSNSRCASIKKALKI